MLFSEATVQHKNEETINRLQLDAWMVAEGVVFLDLQPEKCCFLKCLFTTRSGHG